VHHNCDDELKEKSQHQLDNTKEFYCRDCIFRMANPEAYLLKKEEEKKEAEDKMSEDAISEVARPPTETESEPSLNADQVDSPSQLGDASHNEEEGEEENSKEAEGASWAGESDKDE